MGDEHLPFLAESHYNASTNPCRCDMAKPRIFVSSTFYDLRHVRGEIDRFIRELGYEPVLNEAGHIPYGAKDRLEDYCLKEIEKISILVSIIGNRFGSTSHSHEQYSISNQEIRTAQKLGKQVYIFVEQGVLAEYRTYLKNKDVEITYDHVDDVRIYKFLEQVYALGINNQIKGFSSIPEVTLYLREQWAGLFEAHLAQQTNEKTQQLADTMQSTVETLKDLVNLLKQERAGLTSDLETKTLALDAIILQNHPVFSRIQRILRVKYRVFFTTKQEMEEFFSGYRSIKRVNEDDLFSGELIYRWRPSERQSYLINIKDQLFDAKGNLKPMLPNEWKDDYVVAVLEQVKPPPDDDIPF